MPVLRKELKTRFDLQAGVEKRRKTVLVLTIADSNKVALLKKTIAKKESFSASHGVFQGDDIGIVKIAEYLEGIWVG